MADITPTTPTPSGKKKIPTWYWLAGGGALVAAYLLWKRSTAASTAATTAAAQSAQTADSGTAAGSYGNAGDLSALAPYLQNLQGTASATPAAVSGVNTTPLSGAGQQLIGSGYADANPAGLTDQQGNTYQYISPQQASALQGTGGSIYYEPLPAVFQPVQSLASLAPSTPIYAMQKPAGS